MGGNRIKKGGGCKGLKPVLNIPGNEEDNVSNSTRGTGGGGVLQYPTAFSQQVNRGAIGWIFGDIRNICIT